MAAKVGNILHNSKNIVQQIRLFDYNSPDSHKYILDLLPIKHSFHTQQQAETPIPQDAVLLYC